MFCTLEKAKQKGAEREREGGRERDRERDREIEGERERGRERWYLLTPGENIRSFSAVMVMIQQNYDAN